MVPGIRFIREKPLTLQYGYPESSRGQTCSAGAFWSYDQAFVRNSISDSRLIEAVLVKPDTEDIDLLFKVFPSRKIKSVWLKTMVVQGDYYYSLNSFYA